MNAVLISIQPQWCAKIASGAKTVEVRKTKPKIDTPFKCYIYCTKGNPKDPHQRLETHDPDGKIRLVNGSVFAEFVCDEIFEIGTDFNIHDELPGSPVETWLTWEDAPEEYDTTEALEKAACLSINEISIYMGAADCCYCWHISDLKIYDKPKSLYDFYKCGAASMEELEEELCKYCSITHYGEHRSCSTPNGYWSCEGSWCDEAYQEYLDEEFALTRPPQSWCYVEEE